MRRFDGTVIMDVDAKRFRELVNSHRWIFAKTYAAFCPHEYTLKREWLPKDFSWFAKFVRDNSFLAKYGNLGFRMYFIDEEEGWYYFVVDDDFDENGEVKAETFGLNRASLNQWELIEERSLWGTEYRWKRLPKDRRKTAN